MNRFVQLHILTAYGPSNLNRDDLGRPKSAVMGGRHRLRVSSQCLKRTWRTSDVFHETLHENIGVRTRTFGRALFDRLVMECGLPEDRATAIARRIVGELAGGKEKKREKKGGKAGKAKDVPSESEMSASKDETGGIDFPQIVHLTVEELGAVDALIERVRVDGESAIGEAISFPGSSHLTVDVALFGRMLAAAPERSVEAAVQVSHAITVHEALAEDDFFTAVDDLNRGDVDRGSGHMGETEFGTGLFYNYICVDVEQLRSNLGNDTELAERCLRALVSAATTTSPRGKQNSFASRARASYVLCEIGDGQPRSLVDAFFDVVQPPYLSSAVAALEGHRERMDMAYGGSTEKFVCMHVAEGRGTLAEVKELAISAVSG